MERAMTALGVVVMLACGGSGKRAEPATPEAEAGGESSAATAACADRFSPEVVYKTRVGPYIDERPLLLLLHDQTFSEEDQVDPLAQERSRDPWAQEWSSDEPGFRELSAQEATKVGMDTSATPLWIYADGAQASCRATVTDPVALHDGDALFYTRTAAKLELDDCDLSKRWYALALRQAEPPTCRLEPATAAMKLDAAEILAMGLPADLATALRGEECRDPCTVLFEINGSPSPDGPGFYELTITHLVPDPEVEAECQWDRQDWYAVLFRPGTKQPLQRIEEASGLLATVHDERGLRAAVMSEDGKVAVHHIAKDGATLRIGAAFQWEFPHEEEAAWHSLGESCM